MTTTLEQLQAKKRVLLFDFDGTIFDTAALKVQISKLLYEYTTDTDLLWETEKKLRDERFHLIETMRVFCEKVGMTHIQHTIQDIFLNQEFKNFVFPDVGSSLKMLHRQNILALFSEGDETYQQVKIYQSHLNEQFDFIYIYHKKLQYLDEVITFFEGKEIWYIDNQLAKLTLAQTGYPHLKTVWMNREDLAPIIHFTPDLVITSLDELNFN